MITWKAFNYTANLYIDFIRDKGSQCALNRLFKHSSAAHTQAQAARRQISPAIHRSPPLTMKNERASERANSPRDVQRVRVYIYAGNGENHWIKKKEEEKYKSRARGAGDCALSKSAARRWDDYCSRRRRRALNGPTLIASDYGDDASSIFDVRIYLFHFATRSMCARRRLLYTRVTSLSGAFLWCGYRWSSQFLSKFPEWLFTVRSVLRDSCVR